MVEAAVGPLIRSKLPLPRRLVADPVSIYLILMGGRAFFFCLIFTVDMIYQATVVGLNPFQMVLAGTVAMGSPIGRIPTIGLSTLTRCSRVLMAARRGNQSEEEILIQV